MTNNSTFLPSPSTATLTDLHIQPGPESGGDRTEDDLVEAVKLLHADLPVSHGAQVGARAGAFAVAGHLPPADLLQRGHLQTPLQRAVTWGWRGEDISRGWLINGCKLVCSNSLVGLG